MKACPKCGFRNLRNNDQNSLSHVWYLQIGEFMGKTPIQAKAYCKLHVGVPVLRAEDQEFCAKYDRLLKPLPYETKLELMEWFPVTSLMTMGQFSRYMSDLQHHFGPKGLALMSLNEEIA